MPLESGEAPKPKFLNSNQQTIYEDLKYSEQDVEKIEDWVKRHAETTWH
jgi:alcohol oxidase